MENLNCKIQADLNLKVSIIVSNISGLHVSIRRQRLKEWIKDPQNQNDPRICYLEEKDLKYNTGRLKVEE